METLYAETSVSTAKPGLHPGRYSVNCARCGVAYDVSADTARRAYRNEKLCRSCRGRKGIEHARQNTPFITPESTKAERVRANGLVNSRLKRGAFVVPETCMKCSRRVRLDSHHPDYDKPDEVLWLCRRCHMRGHHRPETIADLIPIKVVARDPSLPPPAPHSKGGRKGPTGNAKGRARLIRVTGSTVYHATNSIVETLACGHTYSRPNNNRFVTQRGCRQCRDAGGVV